MTRKRNIIPLRPDEIIAIFGRMSGKAGNVVFYHRNGIPYYRQAPLPGTVPPTEQQIIRRNLFRDAVAYAKAAIRDPETKAALELRAIHTTSAFQQAIKEFMNERG